MQIDHNGRNRYFTFESWDRFIHYTRETPQRAGNRHWEWMDNQAHWRGDVTCTQADRMADHGWADGASLARTYTDSLVAQIGSMIERQTIAYDVEGAALDLGRYLEGEPECWMRFETERVESTSPKFVRLVVNVGASGAIDASTILSRGAVVAALVELLEFSGMARCEITIVDATRTDIHYSASVVVKTFDQPLDMPLVAYAVAHASVLRRHLFRMYETMDEAGMTCAYGAPADVAPEHQGDIYFQKMHAYETWWRDERQAIAWVLKKLTEYGVALKPSAA